MELVRETFDFDAIGWVRIFTLTDGLLIPHVDFIEFEEPCTRLQLPLRTSPGALHSENETVWHLREGELWWLDAAVPHAACAPPGVPRIALSIDFAMAPGEVGACIRLTGRPRVEPMLVERPELDQDELEALIGLGPIIDRASIRDVLRLLGMVHFRRQAHAAACLDWIVEAVERSRVETLVERAEAFRTYCLHTRSYSEQFVW